MNEEGARSSDAARNWKALILHQAGLYDSANDTPGGWNGSLVLVPKIIAGAKNEGEIAKLQCSQPDAVRLVAGGEKIAGRRSDSHPICVAGGSDNGTVVTHSCPFLPRQRLRPLGALRF